MHPEVERHDGRACHRRIRFVGGRHDKQMLNVLFYLSLTPLEVLAAVPILFAMMPNEFQVYWSNITSGLSASDAQNCLDQSWAADNATIVFGYWSSGSCTYGRAILGYQTRTSTDPQYWVRVDNIIRPTNTCLDHQDAEYLMMKHTFGGKNCPRYGPNLFSGGTESLCRSNTSLGMYGMYEAGGHMTNGTVEVLTKTYATQGVGYQCDDVYTHKMIFNGTWYCYHKFPVSTSYANIAINYCAALKPGSTVIKALSNREYRYVYYIDTSIKWYMGLILPTGTTTFTWYDMSSAVDVPWASGRPETTTGTNNLVVVNYDGTVTDTDAGQMSYLLCRKAANSVPYDYTTRFW